MAKHTHCPSDVVRHGSGYDALTSFFLGGRRRVYGRLAALSGAGPADRGLDVGCGTGNFNRAVPRAVGSGSVVGIDASSQIVDYAARRNRFPNCTFAVDRAEALSAADESFDVVVTSLMLHHLPES